MDSLSRLVALLDPRGRMDLRCLFGRSWAAPHDRIGPWRAPFHIVLKGECELWMPESRTLVPLRAGSLAILPRGATHTLRSSDQQAPARAIRSSIGEVVGFKSNVANAKQADVEILCGEFEFRSRRRSSLLEALPEHLVIDFGDRADVAWLESLVRLMAQEIEQARPGASLIVAELTGTLFTLAIRAHLDTQPELGGLLGLMAHPRLAPALQMMLEQPQQPWTVESLARRCNMSRAAFARDFSRYAGTSPLDLLTRLRMELASRLLSVGTEDTASIGEAVGYRSEAAFNRAFTRFTGVAPGRFRRAVSAESAEAVDVDDQAKS
jgi:AraC family transcriptional activator of mtrCDE